VRIAWDGRGLCGPRTGIGWYTHHLLRAFEHIDEDWSGHILLNETPPDRFTDRFTCHCFPFPRTVRLRFGWENIILPGMLRKISPDIWHSPLSVVPPFGRFPKAVTVHDVAFLHFPEILPRAYRNYWIRHTRRACQQADRILAVSESTRRDLTDFFPGCASRIEVIPEAADPFYNQPPSQMEREEVLSRHRLSSGFLLFVGTLEPRKNLRFLIEACNQLHESWQDCPPLVIAGGKGWLQSDLMSKIGSNPAKIRLLGYLERKELRVLYHEAGMVLIPSLYEGFGLPAVEAMACGAIVVASDASSLPEVVGEGGVLLPIDDPARWAGAIRTLLESPEQIKKLRQSAREQSQKFSWEKTARETFRVFREMV